jgi:hypothetical protein
MLDKTHTPPRWSTTDHNAYEYGELSGHYIVIAHLPGGVYGKVSAAAVASRMRSTFRRLEFGVRWELEEESLEEKMTFD